MKAFSSGVVGLLAVCATAQDGAGLAAGPREELRVLRRETHTSARGPADRFSGDVTISALFQAGEPGRVGGALVSFKPGARTAWHVHPLGQTLIVTKGTGWVQAEGASRQEIREGDIVQIPAGIRHWHGASANAEMTHLAITESLNGSPVTWLDHVSDADYLQAPAPNQ